MPVLASFEGVVLKKYTLLESTQSLTVFTKEKGKMHFIVKGAQKLTSRRSPHLQTGNLITLDASLHKNGSWYVRSTHLVSGFSLLKESEARVRVLYNMLLVLDRLLPLEQADDMVYARLIRAMVHLNDRSNHCDTVLFSFVSELFALLGYGEKSIENYDDVTTVLSHVVDEKVRLLL